MNQDPIPEEDIEFIERNLFQQFDEAYRKHHLDDYPNYDEVVALENALDTISRIRRQITTEQESRRRRTVQTISESTHLD